MYQKVLARDRLHEGGDVQPLVAVVTECDRPLAFRRPDPAQYRLQADAVFVRGPDVDRRVRVLCCFLGDSLLRAFFKRLPLLRAWPQPDVGGGASAPTNSSL